MLQGMSGGSETNICPFQDTSRITQGTLRVSRLRESDIAVICGDLHIVACLRKERAPRVPPPMDWDNPAIFPDDNSGRLVRDQCELNYFC